MSALISGNNTDRLCFTAGRVPLVTPATDSVNNQRKVVRFKEGSTSPTNPTLLTEKAFLKGLTSRYFEGEVRTNIKNPNNERKGSYSSITINGTKYMRVFDKLTRRATIYEEGEHPSHAKVLTRKQWKQREQEHKRATKKHEIKSSSGDLSEHLLKSRSKKQRLSTSGRRSSQNETRHTRSYQDQLSQNNSRVGLFQR